MNIHKRFKLDPLSFETLPSLSWKVAFKNRTSIELEVLTDTNMILFNEKSIRDGVTWAIHQYVETNNQYIYVDGKKVHIFLHFKSLF